MIKKLIIAVATVSMLSLIACGSSQDRIMLKGETESFRTEGWLDGDTFQVRALGAANPKLKRFVQRRTASEEAALLAAQKRAIELMIGSKIKGASGSQSGELTGLVITKEFEGRIKGGAIVKKTFNEDDDCELVWRIHRKGLKKEAEAEIERLNEEQ